MSSRTVEFLVILRTKAIYAYGRNALVYDFTLQLPEIVNLTHAHGLSLESYFPNPMYVI